MKYDEWLEKLGKNPKLRRAVDEWLVKNPTPAQWKGRPNEWAFLSFPYWEGEYGEQGD